VSCIRDSFRFESVPLKTTEDHNGSLEKNSASARHNETMGFDNQSHVKTRAIGLIVTANPGPGPKGIWKHPIVSGALMYGKQYQNNIKTISKKD
jgi:hypothetical protein